MPADQEEASFGSFNLRELFTYGFRSMAREMRTDFAIFPENIFLMIKGGNVGQ